MDGDGKACEGPWPVHTTPSASSEPTTPSEPSTPPPPVTSDPFTPVIAPDCPGTASGYCAHPPSFWAPLIEQAIGLVGGNVNANHNVSAVESLMLSESSGDPNAINNYDSNAQNGDPSRGLMQTIGATFNAYHVSGTSTNIYDPLANIAAALAYINDVYGGVIPNSPY
jgi:soluble lytic murein transglycosylase-like protein